MQVPNTYTYACTRTHTRPPLLINLNTLLTLSDLHNDDPERLLIFLSSTEAACDESLFAFLFDAPSSNDQSAASYNDSHVDESTHSDVSSTSSSENMHTSGSKRPHIHTPTQTLSQTHASNLSRNQHTIFTLSEVAVLSSSSTIAMNSQEVHLPPASIRTIPCINEVPITLLHCPASQFTRCNQLWDQISRQPYKRC
jgi:hypothetical protein